MTTDQLAALRAEFLRLLTTDSETKDRRRKEFNQAIFDASRGYAVWTTTDLDMVMSKFDKAAAGVTVDQPDHSDGCAGNCGTNDHDNPPCPAQDRCRVEPAFSQHEYAVAYCETHDQPADMCAQPDGLDVERLADAFMRSEAGAMWSAGYSHRAISEAIAREYGAAQPAAVLSFNDGTPVFPAQPAPDALRAALESEAPR